MVNESGLVSSEGVIGQHSPNHVILDSAITGNDVSAKNVNEPTIDTIPVFDRLAGACRRDRRVELLVAHRDLERPAGDAAAGVDVLLVRLRRVGDVLVGRARRR